MFDFLRKMIAPIMIIVLVAFVCTIIFSWGGGGFSDKPQDTIAVIDGENISVKVFDQYYSNLLREEQQNTEGEVPPDKIKQIREQAWSQMVADYLINKEIEKHNIVVSNKEIFDFLRFYPPQIIQEQQQFMTDGKFDYQLYLNAMKDPGNAPLWAALESYVMPDLKKYKLQEEVLSTVRVTPTEVMESFLEEREKVKIGHLGLLVDDLRKTVAEPTEEEKQAYYESHKEDYKIGRRATLDIVNFEKKPSDDDWNRVYLDIKDIYDSVLAGEDFGELAKIFSDDGSAQAGGDLGWFERGRMVPAFDSAAFLLKKDEISQPVKTRFGWHIIKLIDRKTEKSTPRGGTEPVDMEKINAAHILLRVEPSTVTLEQIYANATDFAETAHSEGFKETAEQYNYEIQTTQPFVEEGYIQQIGRSPQANEFAFNNEPGAISEVFENPAGYFVVMVDQRFPEGYTEIEKADGSIKYNISLEKSKKMALDSAQMIYTTLMEGNTFAKTASQFGLQYMQSEFFTRNSAIPGIGRADEVIGTAFAMTEINAISKPIEYEKGVAIITLLDRQSPNVTEFNQIQDSLRIAVLQKKQQAVYNSWFDGMMSRTEIENYVDNFYRGDY